MAVAGQVDEPQIRVVPVDVGQRREGRNGSQPWSSVRSKKPGVGPVELDQVELPVAGQVQELLLAAARARPVEGRWPTSSSGPNLPLAQVRLVEPGVGLLGQDAGDTFPVEVDPLVTWPSRPEGRFSRLSGSTSWSFSLITASVYPNSSGGRDFFR